MKSISSYLNPQIHLTPFFPTNSSEYKLKETHIGLALGFLGPEGGCTSLSLPSLSSSSLFNLELTTPLRLQSFGPEITVCKLISTALTVLAVAEAETTGLLELPLPGALLPIK